MFYSNVFNFSRKCKHKHIDSSVEVSYCPDCGKLIKNNWYITRCALCGHKLKTIMKNGKIEPLLRYCDKCGCSNFVIQNIDRVNFIDINFAVVKKEECSKESCSKSLVPVVTHVI